MLVLILYPLNPVCFILNFTTNQAVNFRGERSHPYPGWILNVYKPLDLTPVRGAQAASRAS